MPYMMVQTNAEIPDAAAFMSRSSGFLSRKLGKPESYVMIAIEPATDMMFSGSSESCVYAELKSIGLPESQTTALSQALCEFLATELGVAADRVYIEFAAVPATMWGWNSSTFG